MNDELYHLIALSTIPGLGPVKAKTLLKHTRSAREIFRLRTNSLCEIPDIGRVTANAVAKADFRRAEQEILFIEKEGIRVVDWLNDEYPVRLKQCDDSPLLLYARGNFEWNPPRAISIVGTRKASAYGKHFCQDFIHSLVGYGPTIISGLAHGIDAAAHLAAVEFKLPTIACVAHGLDRIYPPIHRSLATRMESNGGVVTEFMSQSPLAPEMFPMRNRIIAGLSECTLVVETDVKGGSMITAHLAHSYGREVFAVPGRYNDPLSKGCHRLIKNNIAAILTSADDLVQYLNWDQESQAKQTQLDFTAHPDALSRNLLITLQAQPGAVFDDLLASTKFTWGELNKTLLLLEFDGLIKLLPGKRYVLK